MNKKLDITVLVDPGTIPKDDPEFANANEEAITEYHVIEALRELGHEVSIVGAVEDIRAVVNKLTEHRPDLVFNLTEHFGGDRQMDKNIVSLLELLQIPFTGTAANRAS